VNITVLGATGRTGRPLVAELLARGHHVTAVVRDPTTYAPRPSAALSWLRSWSMSSRGTCTRAQHPSSPLGSSPDPSRHRTAAHAPRPGPAAAYVSTTSARVARLVCASQRVRGP
jgi:hypothetical protein